MIQSTFIKKLAQARGEGLAKNLKLIIENHKPESTPSDDQLVKMLGDLDMKGKQSDLDKEMNQLDETTKREIRRAYSILPSAPPGSEEFKKMKMKSDQESPTRDIEKKQPRKRFLFVDVDAFNEAQKLDEDVKESTTPQEPVTSSFQENEDQSSVKVTPSIPLKNFDTDSNNETPDDSNLEEISPNEEKKVKPPLPPKIPSAKNLILEMEKEKVENENYNQSFVRVRPPVPSASKKPSVRNNETKESEQEKKKPPVPLKPKQETQENKVKPPIPKKQEK
jgi:hypothetical protein